jgi:hypothetical protein
MGYIRLLLNAPYKIDSMVWMRLGYVSFFVFLLFDFALRRVNEPR